MKNLKDNGTYDKILNNYLATGDETNTQDAGEQMKKSLLKREYVIASDSTFAPFEFQNAQGDYVGIDVDLVKRAAELQGFTVEFKFIGFSSAVQAVESGQADGMVAGMTITDDRKSLRLLCSLL